MGVVNHGHRYPDGEVGEHMHVHVYHESVGRKGSNDISSLVMKTLRFMNMLRRNDPGGKLVLFFDNCSGQNKNNTVLKLGAMLAELGYFKEVEMLFLIAGHTKNACDHLFNALKSKYRSTNTFTMYDLLQKLNISNSVTVHPSTQDDFFDYTAFLGRWYKHLVGKIKTNHIFKFSGIDSQVGDKFAAHIRQSDLVEHAQLFNET